MCEMTGYILVRLLLDLNLTPFELDSPDSQPEDKTFSQSLITLALQRNSNTKLLHLITICADYYPIYSHLHPLLHHLTTTPFTPTTPPFLQQTFIIDFSYFLARLQIFPSISCHVCCLAAYKPHQIINLPLKMLSKDAYCP